MATKKKAAKKAAAKSPAPANRERKRAVPQNPSGSQIRPEDVDKHDRPKRFGPALTQAGGEVVPTHDKTIVQGSCSAGGQADFGPDGKKTAHAPA